MALIPDYWWPFGNNVTLTQESDPEFRRYSPYSAKLTGDAGVHPRNDPDTGAPVAAFVRAAGMTSSPFPVHMFESHRFVAQECSIKVASGRVALELWDVTGPMAGDQSRPLVIWPPRESGRRAVTQATNTWIEDLFIESFEDFWKSASEKSTHFQLAFLVEEDSTVAYIDWAQMVRDGAAARIPYEGFASNDLMLAATHELLAVGDPLERLQIAALDLTRLDDVAYPGEAFTEGGNALVVVPGMSYEQTRRLLSVEDDPVTGAASKLVVETNQDRMTRRLAVATSRRRQTQRALDPPASIPASIPDALAVLTREQLSVRVYPAPGHFESQVRLQGPGATADERWRAGAIIASEVGTTIEITADQLPPQRPLDLTIKSLGVTGRESTTPFEIDGVGEDSTTLDWRMPIDEQLVLYWPLEELDEPTLPETCTTGLAERTRIDTSPYGNHGYIYTWNFGTGYSPVTVEPGASGMALRHLDPYGASFPSGQVMVDSDPDATGASTPDDQADFDQVVDVTIVGAFRPWLLDPDNCEHTSYWLWGRLGPGDFTDAPHTFEEAGFAFGLTEITTAITGFMQMPFFRMVYWDTTGTSRSMFWPFDWSFGEWESQRGASAGSDSKLQDTWIFVGQRIADDGAGGVNVDVFVGDLVSTTLTKLDPNSLDASAGTLSSAYGAAAPQPNSLETTRWTFMGKGHYADDRDVCSISDDGFWGYGDEHRRWNRALTDSEVIGMFLHMSGQKPADLVFQVP